MAGAPGVGPNPRVAVNASRRRPSGTVTQNRRPPQGLAWPRRARKHARSICCPFRASQSLTRGHPLCYVWLVAEVTVEFAASLDVLTFPTGEDLQVPVSTEMGPLAAVLSTPRSGVLAIRVSTAAVDQDSDSLVSQCAKVASDLADRLAYCCDVGVGPVEYVRTIGGHNGPQATPVPAIGDRGTSTVQPSSGSLGIVGLRPKVDVRRAVVFVAGSGASKAQELRQPLQGQPLFHTLYREVLRSQDAVVRFVMLFAVLEAIVGGERGAQEAIDSWIVGKQPTTETSESPRASKAGRQETVYTRIRNDIVHGAGRQVAPETAREQAERHLEGLQALVKLAIAHDSTAGH